MSEPNNCTFHHNFSRSLNSMVGQGYKSLRSIRLQVIQQLQKEKLAVGSPVCKTSRAFMFAMIGDEDDFVYVQRGYRQYGQMHVRVCLGHDSEFKAERHIRRRRSRAKREPGLPLPLPPSLSPRLLLLPG